jgi:hypothetical protein
MHVFNAVTAPSPSFDAVAFQTPALTQWYERQVQTSPSQFLSRARRSHIITVQQYQAIARSPAAQAEFVETYKSQLDTIAGRDISGNLTPKAASSFANLRDSMGEGRVPGMGPQTRTKPT